MKELRKLNPTTAMAFAVETDDVKKIVIMNNDLEEEEHYICSYEDIILDFHSEDDCDKFVNGYNSRLDEPASLLSESNFLRDMRGYCLKFGIDYNPVTWERVENKKYDGRKDVSKKLFKW